MGGEFEGGDVILLDCDPDIDTDRYGFCPRCQREVRLVKEDFGIGRNEAWGRPIVHMDWQDACVECETVI